MHKTSAWPLAWIYAALIVYASLYPFTDWRDQGLLPWAFLIQPWPRYWTWFDLLSNLLGYAPLGGLLALSALRGAPLPMRHRAVLLATLVAALLSFSMESLQAYLPMRVSSNVDLALNIAGAWIGAVLVWLMEARGAIDHWNRFRNRWFVSEARGALVLLAMWPVGLLFPASVPFGLGQVLERVEQGMAEMLADTPFLDWLPVRDVELQPLVPGAELLCVTLGALVPCLLGYCVIRSTGRRIAFAWISLGVGVGATALSAALSFGPDHAWAWFRLPVQVGLGLAGVLAILALPVSRRGCAAILLLVLAVHLSILNQAPTSAYLSQTLQTWEQGRFIRFHGLAQWLGWIWPYVTLAYLLGSVSRPERVN